jgi:adenine-specific DNA-methyltransferase
MADDRTTPRATLGGTILDWSGRKAIGAILSRLKPRILATLPPDIDPSFGDGPGRDRNLILEGDNLQALASLPKYLGKVDFIYADPPYNTGEEFRYNDKWDDDPNDTSLGPVVLVTDTQRHAKWVSFMLPRLEMMKRFLKPGGVVAVSIDDRELFRLGLLMDQVFGEENQLGILNWQKKDAPSSDSKHVSPSTEYVLVYANRLELANTGSLGRTDQMNSRYSNPDNDPVGLWRQNNPTAKSNTPESNLFYGVQNPFTGDMHYPQPGRQWARKRSTIKEFLEAWGVPYKEVPGRNPNAMDLVVEGDISSFSEDLQIRLQRGAWPRLYWGRDGKSRPNLKAYLDEVKQGRVPMTWLQEDDTYEPDTIGSASWPLDVTGSNRNAKTMLNALMGGHGFDTPKPLRLIKTLIQLWCPPNGIVLDPFGGSGTTAHAVLDLNAENGADRSFILVEPGNPEAKDRQGNPDLFARTLTAERIRRVITGEWADGKPHEPLGGGFTFKTVGQQINREALGSMERNEIIDVIAQIEAGRDPRGFRLEEVGEGFKHLVGRNRSGAAVALVYEGADASVFDEKAAGEVYAEAEKLGMTPPPAIRVYARKKLWADSDFEFRQIPDQILIDLGLEDEADLPEGA